jgi:hypothetical protein
MSTETITPLRQRMIEDMNARKLGSHTQTGHIPKRQQNRRVKPPSPAGSDGGLVGLPSVILEATTGAPVTMGQRGH